MLIDSHAHYDMIMSELGIREDELSASMTGAGIGCAVQISTAASELAWCRDFAVRNAAAGFFFSAGIHPSCPLDDGSLAALENFVSSLLPDEKLQFVGIGECGLDYHYEGFDRAVQIHAFEKQAVFAKETSLPIFVHTRDAWPDTLAVLKAAGNEQGVIHCFSGDVEGARQALDLGFYISFAGNLTYKKSLNLHEAAKFAPIDRVLLETDAPFLSPASRRGKPNRSEHIGETYEFFANIKGLHLTDVEQTLEENFKRLIRRDAL